MEEKSQQLVKKTKKAIRKMKKRENISKKKKLLPIPQKLEYIVNDEMESVLIKGEFTKLNSHSADNKMYLRFKLSGQQDFPTFGYQAKIPVQSSAQFQFEISQAALLDEDEVSIQLFNDQGQASETFTCRYVKKEMKVTEALVH